MRHSWGSLLLSLFVVVVFVVVIVVVLCWMEPISVEVVGGSVQRAAGGGALVGGPKPANGGPTY